MIRYRILYKNGLEDTVYQEATEDNIKEMEVLRSKTMSSMANEQSGVIMLRAIDEREYYIRFSEVIRVETGYAPESKGCEADGNKYWWKDTQCLYVC